MGRDEYTAADITMLSFEEAVRKRTGMYFRVAPDSPDLPANILGGAIDDALHPVGGGHCTVEVEVTGNLRFTVTDDQPLSLDGAGEPEPGFYGSLLGKRRWALAAAAAFSSRTLIEVRVGGRGWRQELSGTVPARLEPFAAPGEADGTRVTFELDAACLAPGAVIPASLEHLRAWAVGCATCPGPLRADALTIRDRRSPQPSAPE
jgi:DNA gyrase/topoisomerase IV subunit B